MSPDVTMAMILCLCVAIGGLAFKGLMHYLQELDERKEERRKLDHYSKYSYEAIMSGGFVMRAIRDLEGKVAFLMARQLEKTEDKNSIETHKERTR